MTKLFSTAVSLRRLSSGSSLLLTLALGIPLAPLSAQTVQTSWQGRGSLVVRASSAQAASALVEFPDGTNQAIDLPEGATLNSVSSLSIETGPSADAGGERWLLAGSKDGAPDGGDGSQLFFLMGESAPEGPGDVREVLPPSMAGETPSLRIGPVLMQMDGELMGLVWLQGDSTRALELWAADWREGSFAAPERIAASGPGSQLALSGAVLRDRSWLLAWSRFDGEDDEIATLRRVDGQWQELAVISNNRVPDITPSVVATEQGALVAWSRFETTGYRLRLRSLSQTGWANPRSVGGEKALYPRFVEGQLSSAEPRARLVYRRSSPRSWVVADLDVTGTVRRQAAVRTEDVSTPAVLEQGNDLVLRFSSQDGMREARAIPERPSRVGAPERRP